MPIPEGKVGANIYPWAFMAVGDMFEVPKEDAYKAQKCVASRQRTSRHRYATRTLQNGNLGIWRIQ